MKTLLLASLALACAVAVTALAACADDDGKSAVAPTVAPRPSATRSVDKIATWMAALPTNTPEGLTRPFAAGPDDRPCVGADLIGGIWGPQALTGGQLIASIVVGNRSNSACKLSRLPGFELLDADGNAIPEEVHEGTPCPSFFTDCIYQEPILLLPGLSSFDPPVQPGQATLQILWPTHDGAGSCAEPPPTGKTVRLSLPDNGGFVLIPVDFHMGSGGIFSCLHYISVFQYGSVPGVPQLSAP
jgi:hypothetical protein